jgi:hypothetical protein
MRQFLILGLFALGACSTDRQALELRRDRLLAIEANAQQVRERMAAGTFQPEKYDVYLALDADVFQRAFAEIAGSKIEIDAKGRPVTIDIERFATNFRPGSPEITLAAKAIDRRSGLEAAVDLDTRMVLIGDPATPDELTAKIYATRLVPKVRWGPLDFTRARFVRSLLALEGSKLTDKLPAMRLPLAKAFSFGSPAQTFDSGQIPTGNGSWIRGDVALPDTETKGRFVVNHILFLENGVHIFASVEGV